MTILTSTQRTFRSTLPKLCGGYRPLNWNCYREGGEGWLRERDRGKLGSVMEKRRYTELTQPQRQEVEEEEEEVVEEKEKEVIEVIEIDIEKLFKRQLKLVTTLVLKGRLASGWRDLKSLDNITLSVEELELLVGYKLSQKSTPDKVVQWLRYCRRERGEELIRDGVDWSDFNHQVEVSSVGSKLLRWAVPEETHQWLTAGEGRDQAWCNPFHCILLSYQHQLSYYRDHQYQEETYDFTKVVPDHPSDLALTLLDNLKFLTKSNTEQVNLGQNLMVVHSLKAVSVATGKMDSLLQGTEFLEKLSTEHPPPPQHPFLYLPLMEGFTTIPPYMTSSYYSGRLRLSLKLRHLMVETQTTFHHCDQFLPLLESCFPPEHPPLPLLEFRIPTHHGSFLRECRAGVYLRVVERERRRDQLPITPKYLEYLLALESLNFTSSTPFPTRWQRLHDIHQLPISQGAYRLLFGYLRDEPAYLEGFKSGVESLELAVRTNRIPRRTIKPSLITSLIEATVFYQDSEYYCRVLVLILKEKGLPTLPTLDLCQLTLHTPTSLPFFLLTALENCLINLHLDTSVGPFALLTFYARSHQPTKVHQFFLTYLQFYRQTLPFTSQLTDGRHPTLSLIPLDPTPPPHPIDSLTTALVSELILTYLNQYHHPTAALRLLHSFHSFLPITTTYPPSPPPYFPHRTLHALLPHATPSSPLPLTPLTTVDLEPLLPILYAFRRFHYPPHFQ